MTKIEQLRLVTISVRNYSINYLRQRGCVMLGVCLFVCLFVRYCYPVCVKNYWTDLHDNFDRRCICSQGITYWIFEVISLRGSASRNFIKDSSTLPGRTSSPQFGISLHLRSEWSDFHDLYGALQLPDVFRSSAVLFDLTLVMLTVTLWLIIHCVPKKWRQNSNHYNYDTPYQN